MYYIGSKTSKIMPTYGKERNMYWLEQLKQFKSDKHATYKDIALGTDIPLTTVEKLFSGRTSEPKLKMVSDIASYLGHSISELVADDKDNLHLTAWEYDFIKSLRQLDSYGLNHVKLAVSSELKRIKSQKPNFSRLYYDFPVSAGTGEYLDDTTAAIINLTDEPPHGTDYVLRIAGNSMEPEFYDGDYVYVKRSPYVEYGEIGIFVVGGNVYMKEYSPHGLKSLNPKYRIIDGTEDIRCLGKVLGKVHGNVEIS